ncbi:MAG: nucleotidyltransferase family protein [bacterium]
MDSSPPASSSPLLLCLQASLEPGRPGTPRDPAGWTRVTDLACRQELAPLLYHELGQARLRDRVPGPDLARLERAYYLNADRNIRIYRELRPVLACLRDSDIPVIVLKGALLAEAVYGNIALRTMGDVDLLVPRAGLARARAALVAAGCAHAEGDIEAACRVSHQLDAFVAEGLSVEIHWTIERPTSPFAIDTAGLWARARPVRVAGVEVLTLSPEDLLLHLCLHVAYHHGLAAGLTPFCDIARVIECHRAGLDWPRLARTAGDWGAARHAGLALELARILLGARVPREALERLVPGGISPTLLDTARECVLASSSLRQWKPRSLYELFGAESPADGLTVVRRRLFMSRAGLAARYSSARGQRQPGSLRARWFGHLARSCWSYFVRPRLARLGLLGRGHDRGVALADWLGRTGTRDNQSR